MTDARRHFEHRQQSRFKLARSLLDPRYIDIQGEAAMSAIDSNTQHQAVVRLFELSRTGEIDSTEFEQLDSMIYGGLEQTYRVTAADVEERQVVTSAI